MSFIHLLIQPIQLDEGEGLKNMKMRIGYQLNIFGILIACVSSSSMVQLWANTNSLYMYFHLYF